jgi:hypothetical protein
LFWSVHSVVSWEQVRLRGLQTVIWNGRPVFFYWAMTDVMLLFCTLKLSLFIGIMTRAIVCLECCCKYYEIQWGRIRLCAGKAGMIFECIIYLQLRS